MSIENQIFHFTAQVPNVEIRKVEEVDNSFDTTDKDGKPKHIESHVIHLTCDVGEDMDRVIFKDKNLSNLGNYKRGMIGTAYIRLDVEQGFGSKTKMTLIDFKEDKGSKGKK